MNSLTRGLLIVALSTVTLVATTGCGGRNNRSVNQQYVNDRDDDDRDDDDDDDRDDDDDDRDDDRRDYHARLLPGADTYDTGRQATHAGARIALENNNQAYEQIRGQPGVAYQQGQRGGVHPIGSAYDGNALALNSAGTATGITYAQNAAIRDTEYTNALRRTNTQAGILSWGQTGLTAIGQANAAYGTFGNWNQISRITPGSHGVIVPGQQLYNWHRVTNLGHRRHP